MSPTVRLRGGSRAGTQAQPLRKSGNVGRLVISNQQHIAFTMHSIDAILPVVTTYVERHMHDSDVEPLATLLIDEPRQIKAFTDPLRVRVLVVLAERAATNQQVADALAEPQAKVLYHIRFLLEVGLIRLIDTRVKGGNVEKYYRAVARSFSIQPTPELRGHVIGAEFQMLGDELAQSALAWPDEQWVAMHARRLTRAQAEELGDLVYAYMQSVELSAAAADDQVHDHTIGFVLFRNPRDAEEQRPQSATEA
jgi:DNA-binding transcriptional ArsR family regulator